MRNLIKLIICSISVLLISVQAVAADYHVLINDQQQGPVSMEQLQQMKNKGEINKDTLVWKNGMAGWEKAATQRDLQSLFAGAVPPPPPVPGAILPPAPPAAKPVSSSHNNYAQKVTAEEREDSSVHNFPKVSEIAGSNLEKQRDNWLKKEPPKKLGFDRKGSYIGWGMATIEVDPKQVDFGQKRIMAFEKAFADAKGKFVRTKKQQVATKVVRKFFHDDKEQNDVKLKDGRVVGLGKKLGALAEAKLDKALADLGVDPKEIENSDIVQKRKLAEDSISKEITIDAVQRIPGIIILATFEDVKGVGVLIKQNRNYSNLANAIASHKLVGYPSKTNPVDDITVQLEQLFINNNDYIPQYGVRIMADEVGNRVLVSFGQWSPKVTRNDSRMKINMSVKAAKNIAYNQALSYMTQFVNTTLSLKDATKLKDSNAINEITRTSKNKERIEDSSVGASIDKFTRDTSNVSIEGVTETMDWAVNHPETGHLIVGKVLMWSPVTQEHARQKPQQRNNQTTHSKKVRKIQSKIRTSVDIGDEDF